MSPCDRLGTSAMRRDALARNPIEVSSQPVEIYAGSSFERRLRGLGIDEPLPTQWRKLADRNTIPGHNKGFTLVELAHDFAAVIA